uniref:Thoeris anti-defense 2-like domain-containing protein n=1 Tax=Podoviridae sp. ctlpi2 TaxID=2826574 RepID=A0A8S5MLC6_9CAUD|nr:MAG TPA: Protein of unknown function (DUF2829) [Podoviridae sp. ctlpi2]
MPEQNNPKTTGLTFAEALDAAKNGKGICRRSWLKERVAMYAMRDGKKRDDSGRYGIYLFLTSAADGHRSYEDAEILIAIGRRVMPDNGRDFYRQSYVDIRRLQLNPVLWFVGEATPDGTPLSAWGARPDDLLAEDWMSFSFYE